jgi:homeobox-leucine zipper protein
VFPVWFCHQNLQERYDNTQLRAEIDRLRAENLTIRETIKQQQLASCNESASMQQEMADEEIKRRTGSAQLREEVMDGALQTLKYYCKLERPYYTACCMTTCVCQSLKESSCGYILQTELVAAMPNGAATTAAVGGPPLVNVFHDSLSLELAVGRRPTLQESMVAGMMKGGEDQQQQQQQQQQSQSMLGVALSWPGGMSGPDKAALMDLADSALQEILHMVQAKEPLWIKMGATGDQALDADAYLKRFPSKAVMQAPGLVTEASRHTGVVNINSLGLIDALMDAVGFASTILFAPFVMSNVFKLLLLKGSRG